MYKCKCGYSDAHTDYCEDCDILLSCDCSEIESGRFKDLIVEYENGCTNITIHYEVCSVCGFVVDVWWNGV